MESRLEQHIAAFEKTRTLVASYWRWLATAAVCVVATALCVHVMLGSNGAMAYRQKRTDCSVLQKDIDNLNKENADLQARVKALQTDPKAIEKEAREQLRYARPGEVIYVMPDQPGPKPSASATAANQTKP
jgi:cell division protein FtsB